MPQKKRLELKPDHNLKTQKFYSTKKFVFVLDLQIFYESGSVLKIVLPSGRLKYIHLQSTFESFKLGRSIGLGFIEGNNFHWIDFYPKTLKIFRPENHRRDGRGLLEDKKLNDRKIRLV